MNKLSATIIGTAVCAALVAPAFADDKQEMESERQAWRGQAQVASRIMAPGDALHPDRCAGPAAILGGAGLTTILGLVVAEQSHCLNPDFSFDHGRFVFTATDGRTIVGQYYGQIVPALPPPGNEPPANGVILGMVCVEGGTAFDHIVNDCARRRFVPARGVLNLTTGDGTIFLDYVLRVRR